MVPVCVVFVVFGLGSGGLELLFGKVKDHTLELPAAPPASGTGTATATATASTATTTKAGAATSEGTATATTTAETTDASATAAGSGAGGGAGAGAASDGSSSGSVWTMKELIKYIVDNTLQERPELFTVDDTV